MPIKGKMVAIPYGDRIEAMKIGQVGYIEADDLIVTRDCVFIDILIQVILEENFLKNDDEDTESVNKNCIRVTRIGPGITDNDYELDVSILKDYEFILEDDSMYVSKMQVKERYIIFTDFTLEIYKRSNIIEKIDPLISLEYDLKAALNEEKYELVKEIENKIEALKKKNNS
jgi:hypothetical protein